MTYEFPIVAPPTSSHTVFAGVCVLMLALLIFFAVLALGVGKERFQISSDGLKITARFYGRTIAARDLDVAQAHPVDLNVDPNYRLTMRSNGTGLPGYQAGWFRMANGGKALAFVTDKQSVVYIPTRQNYAVLLSVADPEGFARALKSTVPVAAK
jgi:hypothetical protein